MAKAYLVTKKTVIFNPDDSYNDNPFGPDGLTSAWNKLGPRTRAEYLFHSLSRIIQSIETDFHTAGKGHVRVEEPAAWKLSGGFPLDDRADSGAEEYTISLFHQLHCLVSIDLESSICTHGTDLLKYV